MDASWFLYALGAVVVGGAFFYFTWLAAKKRREEFAGFAAQYGLAYQPENHSLANNWMGEPFQTGDNWQVRNVLTGPFQGRQIVAFDYSYQTETRDSKGKKSTTTHKFGVVVMQLPGPLPHLEVTHEGIFGGSVANAFGFADLQFESEQFNRTFRVKADDPRFGHAVIHPQMMEMLLARGEIGWRIEGNSLIGWDSGKHTPVEVLNRLQLLQLVTDHVPPYVWRDYAGIDPHAGR